MVNIALMALFEDTNRKEDATIDITKCPRMVQGDSNLQNTQATLLYYNNQSADQLMKRPELHARTKHIHHFNREEKQSKEVEFRCCKNKDKLVNIFTKALNVQNIQKFRMTLSMKENKMVIFFFFLGGGGV
jgi:hypothetical protein